MARAAKEAGVPVVTGDTKVVERGKGDGVFITTTGVGVLPDGVNSGASRARPGDVILVSGTLGDHGVAIMSQRENLASRRPSSPTRRRCNGLIGACWPRCRPALPARPDARRAGGDAQRDRPQSGVGMMLDEAAIPVKPVVECRLRIPRPRPALRRQRRQAGGDLQCARRRTRC
jgi:hydrogenase expression/formation protein HypE